MLIEKWIDFSPVVARVLLLLAHGTKAPSNRGRGGIGRRAGFRCLFPYGSGGSNPLGRNVLRHRNYSTPTQFGIMTHTSE